MQRFISELGKVRGVARERAEDWRILRLLALYRLVLVTLLVLMQEGGFAPYFLDAAHPNLLRWVSNGYAMVALILILPVQWRGRRVELHTHLQFFADLVALELLLYACGGVRTGLAVLMVTPAVASAMILSRRMAVMHAAAATLATFALELMRQPVSSYIAADFTATGVLGSILFGSTVAANLVAQRARASEALARQAGTEAEDLSLLNERIVESIGAGVVVVDRNNRIRSTNATARRMLVRSELPKGFSLRALDPGLDADLEAWRHAGEGVTAEPRQLLESGEEVVARFTLLGRHAHGDSGSVLITLEDAARLREQAQQMKLAALGRLSANIAHEIRNPLAAIVQASQLLSESPWFERDEAKADLRLLSMVQRHGDRIEKIVRDVLALSRREGANPIQLDLGSWLRRAIALYQESFPDQPRAVKVIAVEPGLAVRFDPLHLQQILFNLWDNAFAHGGLPAAEMNISLNAGEASGGRAWLEISDNGSGIPPDIRDRIFEPFFTTSHTGTGLGLHLARDLCEYNQARIIYISQPRGACFRLLFAA